MPTVAEVIRYLQGLGPETVVVLDQNEAESLDTECDYVALSTVLEEVR